MYSNFLKYLYAVSSSMHHSLSRQSFLTMLSQIFKQPWIFTEIKEQRHWDISSGERFNILKDFVCFGLQHWGSDSKGISIYFEHILVPEYLLITKC